MDTVLIIGLGFIIGGSALAIFHLMHILGQKDTVKNLTYRLLMALMGGLCISIGANLIASNIHDTMLEVTKSAESELTYYSTGNIHKWTQFLSSECLEVGNYDYEDMKKLESKYNLHDDSAVIWVSKYPEVAASYEIGQGIIHNDEQSVIDDWGFSKDELKMTKFGQIYLPAHVPHVDEYSGTLITETYDSDGGYLLYLNRNS